jgi:hypothetical protein
MPSDGKLVKVILKTHPTHYHDYRKVLSEKVSTKVCGDALLKKPSKKYLFHFLQLKEQVPELV